MPARQAVRKTAAKPVPGPVLEAYGTFTDAELKQKWGTCSPLEAMKAVYDLVRDDHRFRRMLVLTPAELLVLHGLVLAAAPRAPGLYVRARVPPDAGAGGAAGSAAAVRGSAPLGETFAPYRNTAPAAPFQIGYRKHLRPGARGTGSTVLYTGFARAAGAPPADVLDAVNYVEDWTQSAGFRAGCGGALDPFEWETVLLVKCAVQYYFFGLEGFKRN